jgi:hypothetical protein
VVYRLPIVFPAVAEKVIEKVVEKVKEVTKYIAVNLTSNVSALIHKYPLTKPSLPTPSIVKTITSISILVYSLKLYLTSLAYKLIKNPSLPSIATLFSFALNIISRSCIDAKKPYLSYSIIRNPSKPSASLLSMFSASIGGVRVMDAKKPIVSYARVISPSKPTPTVNQFSTSVDVRKSP